MLMPAVFLDRDGVINKEKGYVYKIKDFEWINDAKKAIKYLNDNKYLVFVVTNQSGIGRGYYSNRDVKILHDYINKELNVINAHIDEFFYSPYHPDGIYKNYVNLSHLRKPQTGMLELAEKKWGISKKLSYMIGDMPHDIECAEKFGIKGYLFKSGSLLQFIKNIENFRLIKKEQ